MKNVLSYAFYALIMGLATSATTTTPMARTNQRTHVDRSKVANNHYHKKIILKATARQKTVEKPKSFLEKCHTRAIATKKWIKSWFKKPTKEETSRSSLYLIGAYALYSCAKSLYEAHKEAARVANITNEAILFDKCFVCQENFTPRTEIPNTPERNWPANGPARPSTAICNNGHRICNDCLDPYRNSLRNPYHLNQYRDRVPDRRAMNRVCPTCNDALLPHIYS